MTFQDVWCLLFLESWAPSPSFFHYYLQKVDARSQRGPSHRSQIVNGICVEDTLRVRANATFVVPTLSETWKREMNWEFGPESEDLWASIFPGKGFILVDHPERYDLPSGLATSVIDAAVYGVSVTHQIHCIASIPLFMAKASK